MSQEAMALDYIYLRPTLNIQQGHELYRLYTNSVITRRRCTSMPLTPSIIKQVHALAAIDNMPQGLKIQNRTGITLFDSSWTAGGDYDKEQFDDKKHFDDDNYSTVSDQSEKSVKYDKIDENELAEILQEPPSQSAGVINNNEMNNDEENNEMINKNEINDEENNEMTNDEENNEMNNEDNEELNENESINEYDSADDSKERGLEEKTIDNSENEDNADDGIDVLEEGEEEIIFEDQSEQNISPGLRQLIRERATNLQCKDYYSHLKTSNISQIKEYGDETAKVIGLVMAHFNDIMDGLNDEQAYSFIQTYSLKRGLKHFGKKGKQAVNKEMLQLHNRKTFAPIHVHKLSKREKARAMESLIFLAEKRDKSVKARTCANGSTQRTYILREEAASPTAATESVMITGVVEAKQQRYLITLDTPNAFVQTPVPQGKEKIIMKIRGVLVDILMELCPGVYNEYVTYEQGQKVL